MSHFAPPVTGGAQVKEMKTLLLTERGFFMSSSCLFLVFVALNRTDGSTARIEIVHQVCISGPGQS